MRLKQLTVLIVVCCSAMLTGPAGAQINSMKVKFEVDGKEVKQKFKVMLYIDGEAIEPPVSEGGFIAPPEVRNSQKIGVRFLSGEYDLFFDPVRESAFGTDWIVGVDNKPFDEENSASEEPGPPDKELSVIYYLTFVSKKGLDTRMVVKVYK
jgi:hypothetical protein